MTVPVVPVLASRVLELVVYVSIVEDEVGPVPVSVVWMFMIPLLELVAPVMSVDVAV